MTEIRKYVLSLSPDMSSIQPKDIDATVKEMEGRVQSVCETHNYFTEYRDGTLYFGPQDLPWNEQPHFYL